MNLFLIVIILISLALITLVKKRKSLKQFSVKEELAPNIKNIILTVLLILPTLLSRGYPFDMYNKTCLREGRGIGFISGGCFEADYNFFLHNILLDLIIWYLIATFIIFIFKLNKK